MQAWPSFTQPHSHPLRHITLNLHPTACFLNKHIIMAEKRQGGLRNSSAITHKPRNNAWVQIQIMVASFFFFFGARFTVFSYLHVVVGFASNCLISSLQIAGRRRVIEMFWSTAVNIDLIQK